MIVFNILLAVILIPVNLGLAFGPDAVHGILIFLGVGSLLLLYALRQFRGVVISSDVIAENPFQFFVYLCAIEILPILVLIKLFITN